MSTTVDVGTMEMGKGGSGDQAGSWRKKIHQVLAGKSRRFPGLIWVTLYKVGRDDPRRVVHAFKVGLALTSVSLLYLKPLFEGIGENAIWAVMTVVVVLEFTAGATLCKGLNRGLGTLLAGSLAFLVDFIAEKTGNTFGDAFIGAAVFFIGASTTYMRFIPYLRKNYDYGIVIFLQAFNLVTVSSYRENNVLKIARERFYTIAIGCGICLCTSLLIFPIWSGADLHNSTVCKLEGLARSIETCVKEYFVTPKKNRHWINLPKIPFLKGTGQFWTRKHKMKHCWEPRHSLRCRYPWQQYVKLGTVLRSFGYTVVALHGCLESEIQTPKCCCALYKNPCIRLAKEVSKVLIELANSIKMRRRCSPEILSDHLHEALQDLNAALNSQPRLFLGSDSNKANNTPAFMAAQAGQNRENSGHGVCSSIPSSKTKKGDDKEQGERKTLRAQLSKNAITSLQFSEALPFAAFASLLVEVVARLENIIEQVEELGRIACFKEFKHGDEAMEINRGTLRVDITHLPSDFVE